jgi:type II secretory pathway pseudopilin PulG
MSHMIKRLKGFSLIELVVYMGILMLVSAGSVTLLLSLQNQVYRYQANQALTRNATSILERAMFDIRGADTVSSGTFNSNPGALTLLNGATSTAYTVSSGNLNVSVNGGAPAPLTGNAVSATNVVFNQYDNGVSKAIRLSLTLQTTVRGVTVTETFTDTGVLLSSY